MAFVTRTRILTVGSGTATSPVAITPTVFRTGAVGVVYPTMAEAMASVPAGQRPPPEDWDWKYALQWLVQSHVLPTIRGVVPNTGRLVFDVDFWETEADQQASLPPARRNTFVHEFIPKALAGAGPAILASIDDYLLRAEFGGYPSDGRDPRIATTTDPAQDPLGLLTRPAIADKDGVYRTLPATWRGAA